MNGMKKLIQKSLFLISIFLISCSQAPKEYSDDMLSMPYPSNYTVEDTENALSFKRIGSTSTTNLFFVTYLQMGALDIFEDDNTSAILDNTCQSMSKQVEMKYKTYESTAPALDTLYADPAYSFTYTGVTGLGKTIHGFYMVLVHNGCMFTGIVQQEDIKEYDKLVACLYQLVPKNEKSESQTTIVHKEPSKMAAIPVSQFTKTYSKDGLSFRYPKEMIVTESEEDGETKLVCSFAEGATAIMNVNFSTNAGLMLMSADEVSDLCKEALEEMQSTIGAMYKDFESTAIKKDKSRSYPSSYFDYSGKLFGMQLRGHAEMSIKNEYVIVVILQAESEELLKTLHSIRSTFKVESVVKD